MISNRIIKALQAKIAIGHFIGRPTSTYCIDSRKADIIKYIENGFNIIAVAKLIDCNRQTLSKWLVQNQSDADIQKALIKALIKGPK